MAQLTFCFLNFISQLDAEIPILPVVMESLFKLLLVPQQPREVAAGPGQVSPSASILEMSTLFL